MMSAPSGIPDRRVDEVLDLVGLASVAHKGPRSFSLGMVQRLGLAVALLGHPEVLLLDEPANGLGPQRINWLRCFLRAWRPQDAAFSCPVTNSPRCRRWRTSSS